MIVVMSNQTPFRWGILGTGWIADRFVSDLKFLKDHQPAAVGSRSLEKARDFARTQGIPRAWGSYEELVADPDIDAVYITSPHPGHLPHTLLALKAGKPVLVEKPFALDAAEARQMVSLARSQGLFLMEAMWTRFLPHVVRIRQILKEGKLGRIVSVQADHGQWFPENREHRLYAPELGGGALLDLGIYPVSFAHMVLGKPKKITAAADLAFTGVDAQTSAVFQYEGGAQAVLTTTLAASSSNRAQIVGTEARIEVDSWFFCPSSFRVVDRSGQVLERFEHTYQGHGLREEAAEAARCIRAGLKESPGLPLDESLEIMESLDEIRRQIGLDYAKLV